MFSYFQAQFTAMGHPLPQPLPTWAPPPPISSPPMPGSAGSNVEAGAVAGVHDVDLSAVYGGVWSKTPILRCRVFKYNFIDGTCELVDQLPEEWADKGCSWLTPQPAIAPTEEIRKRLQKPKNEADSQPQLGAHFRIYVGNLPRKVGNYQLRQLFSKHGKIHDVRVIRDRRTGRSRGFGFITMSTATDEKSADAIAKLNGQCLDGRSLRVKLENQ
ncbi:hypothetical protein EJB05_28924, partial [Eragrostis curvula]